MKKKIFRVIKILLEVTLTVIVFGIGVAGVLVAYFIGLAQGYKLGIEKITPPIPFIKQIIFRDVNINPNQNSNQNKTYSKPTWNGVDLWNEVNKRRVELGVNELGKRDELCTIASIRLNELLDLGKLDAHEGFSKLSEERKDLRWIFEKYNLSEFLIQGPLTAKEAVGQWENTLGHSAIVTGGEYVWGCTYAQDGFGVAIAAY